MGAVLAAVNGGIHVYRKLKHFHSLFYNAESPMRIHSALRVVG